MKQLKVLLLLAFLSNVAFSQEDSWWFFGNGAGIHFTPNGTFATLKGQLFTEEGCSSISDKKGNLLLYTNGVKVWNGEHKLIADGLRGGVSSTQSGVIVKRPKSENQYYVFTVAEKARYEGLSYTLLDLSRKEPIITKNKTLLNSTSEKLEIIQHKNGSDYWVITHQWGSDKFYAFLLTSKGIINKPVISSIGAVHKDFSGTKNSTAIGYLTASKNGKLLASTICYKPNAPIELYDFNSETGEVTNHRNIPTSGYAYGLEFSPNNKLLYATFLKGKAGVVQYDISKEDLDEGAVILTDNKVENTFGAIRLAPDGKIYVAKTGTYLDVIKYPNKQGSSCTYVRKGFDLKGNYSVYGLPKVVLSGIGFEEKSVKKEEVEMPSELCAGTVTLDAGVANAVYLWNTKETTRTITVEKPGLYHVKISKPENIASETVSFNVTKGEPYVNLGKDTVMKCKLFYELDAKNKGYNYLWSTGAKTQKIKVTHSDIYSVTVTNGKCKAIDSVKVIMKGEPTNLSVLTAFSPENEGFNNTFDYSINNVIDFNMKVLDGNKVVFETIDPTIKWDGKNSKGKRMKNKTYNWVCTYISACSIDGKKVEKKGTVRLY